MAEALLTDREQLTSLFEELARELELLGTRAEIVMVGGAWMLWQALRHATRDVDSARPLEDDISRAVLEIATRHNLGKRWLNDRAAGFWPANARYEESRVVFHHSALTVRAPNPEVIFAMKLYRADPQDREDMILLWPLCNFADPEIAARAFRLAYPHAPEDEHLVDYIAEVARDSDQS